MLPRLLRSADAIPLDDAGGLSQRDLAGAALPQGRDVASPVHHRRLVGDSAGCRAAQQLKPRSAPRDINRKPVPPMVAPAAAGRRPPSR
jgi:hypothetical protein